jgi:hypothetical protein
MATITKSQLRRLAATILFGSLILLPAIIGVAPARTSDAAPPAAGKAIVGSVAL